MKCNCLETIRQKLTASHGEKSDVELDLKATIRVQPDVEEYEIGASLPPLYYSYKDGKKRKKSFVTFNFCPFCGQKP